MILNACDNPFCLHLCFYLWQHFTQCFGAKVVFEKNQMLLSEFILETDKCTKSLSITITARTISSFYRDFFF